MGKHDAEIRRLRRLLAQLLAAIQKMNSVSKEIDDTDRKLSNVIEDIDQNKWSGQKFNKFLEAMNSVNQKQAYMQTEIDNNNQSTAQRVTSLEQQIAQLEADND